MGTNEVQIGAYLASPTACKRQLTSANGSASKQKGIVQYILNSKRSNPPIRGKRITAQDLQAARVSSPLLRFDTWPPVCTPKSRTADDQIFLRHLAAQIRSAILREAITATKTATRSQILNLGIKNEIAMMAHNIGVTAQRNHWPMK